MSIFLVSLVAYIGSFICTGLLIRQAKRLADQNKHLRQEVERLREQNTQLRDDMAEFQTTFEAAEAEYLRRRAEGGEIAIQQVAGRRRFVHVPGTSRN